jgi:hypothetical protein
MRVLVACEYSARVRDAFRARGHDAWSCDVVPTTGDPSFHMERDVRDVLGDGWDLLLAFPPCQYLTNSNAWRWDAIATERERALAFVRTLLDAPVPRVALENPAGAIGSAVRRADQYVQPWHFGDPYQKTTGLWLRDLPKLHPEVTTKPADVRPWAQGGYATGDAAWQRAAGGAVRTARERSLTFPGIARAMAEQWG